MTSMIAAVWRPGTGQQRWHSSMDSNEFKSEDLPEVGRPTGNLPVKGRLICMSLSH